MKTRNILLVLIVIQVCLITLGGYIYSLIPIDQDDEASSCKCDTDSQIDDLFTTHSYDSFNTSDQDSITTTSRIETKKKNSSRPSLSDSVFFVITTVTTIGYGKLTPTSDAGKIFTIIVSLIGIPVNIVFLAKIGEILKRGFSYILKPIKRFFTNKKKFIIMELFISITIGTVIFVLLPGLLIKMLENWNYIDAIYYIFITLFTIGFGDFVAGAENLELDTNFLTFYRFLLYLWMYLGMAYISLIINLCLDFLKVNAESLRKEIQSIIEEKINLTIKRHFMQRKSKANFKKRTMSESDLDRNNVIKLRINYSEEKLRELAQKRRASKVGRLPRVATSFNFQQIIDEAEALEQQRTVDQANSPTSFANNYYHSKENPAFEPNEFDNDLYLNNVNLDSSQSGSQLITKPHNDSTTATTRPVFKIGDDCLKIDIESIPDSPSDSNNHSQHQNHQHPQPQHDSNNNNFASNEYYNVTSDRKISDDIQLQSRRKRSVHSMTGDVLGKRFSIISTRHNDETGHHEHHKISHVNDASTGGSRGADSDTNEFEIYITKSNLFDDALSSRI